MHSLSLGRILEEEKSCGALLMRASEAGKLEIRNGKVAVVLLPDSQVTSLCEAGKNSVKFALP